MGKSRAGRSEFAALFASGTLLGARRLLLMFEATVLSEVNNVSREVIRPQAPAARGCRSSALCAAILIAGQRTPSEKTRGMISA